MKNKVVSLIQNFSLYSFSATQFLFLCISQGFRIVTVSNNKIMQDPIVRTFEIIMLPDSKNYNFTILPTCFLIHL